MSFIILSDGGHLLLDDGTSALLIAANSNLITLVDHWAGVLAIEAEVYQ